MMAAQDLLRRGYLFASINYRLAPEYKFPAQIEDVKCAVRFLRAHASEYKLNPNRIGAIGTSAGGHLVALLGVSAGATDLEGKGGWSDQSSRVQAVADLFGPTDLTMGAGGRAEQLGEAVFGAKSADDPVLKRASPVTYVSKDNPPFLMMHGDKDPVVPLRHSESLLMKMKAAGVTSTLVVVTNAGHGFAPVGGEPNPSRTEIGRMIADFFDRSLKQ
jgi:acetyl esterase/lipase